MPNLELGDQLIDDKRVHQIANKLAAEFPPLLAYGFELVTWVQEPKMVENDKQVKQIPAMAALGILSPHPKMANSQKLSSAAMLLEHWRAEEQEYNRLVGREDPALRFYRVLTRHHLSVLDSVSELIEV